VAADLDLGHVLQREMGAAVLGLLARPETAAALHVDITDGSSQA
jgi:hypothetical protein